MKPIMKPSFIILAIVCLSFTVKKNKSFVPPGTVEVNDTLFFDTEEITNFSWLEYVTWNQQIHGIVSPEYIKSLPDTFVWRDNMAYNEPYVAYYFRHPAYKNHPVVGISYEQAIDYCKWRTQIVNIASDAKELKVKCEYRLPTKKEWEAMALLGFSDKAKKQIEKNKTHTYYNTITSGGISDATTLDNADVTAPTKSYYENRLGIYNLTGNVAEMLAEKGICKGGSWRNSLADCAPEKDTPYSKPTSWLGFRCVCVVKNN